MSGRGRALLEDMSGLLRIDMLMRTRVLLDSLKYAFLSAIIATMLKCAANIRALRELVAQACQLVVLEHDFFDGQQFIVPFITTQTQGNHL